MLGQWQGAAVTRESNLHHTPNASAFILVFPDSRTVRNTRLLFKSLSERHKQDKWDIFHELLNNKFNLLPSEDLHPRFLLAQYWYVLSGSFLQYPAENVLMIFGEIHALKDKIFSMLHSFCNYPPSVLLGFQEQRMQRDTEGVWFTPRFHLRVCSRRGTTSAPSLAVQGTEHHDWYIEADAWDTLHFL